MTWPSIFLSFFYLMVASGACWKVYSQFKSFVEHEKEEAEDLALLKNAPTDLPKNVISIQPYNVFKEVLIEFLEVEKKTDMYTYATMRSRVLRKAKRLLDME